MQEGPCTTRGTTDGGFIQWPCWSPTTVYLLQYGLLWSLPHQAGSHKTKTIWPSLHMSLLQGSAHRDALSLSVERWDTFDRIRALTSSEQKMKWQRLWKESAATYLADQQCDLHLNTPHSSQTGGVWESQIRMVRSMLSTVLAHSAGRLDDISLRKFLYEAIANNRPLTVDNINVKFGAPHTKSLDHHEILCSTSPTWSVHQGWPVC